MKFSIHPCQPMVTVLFVTCIASGCSKQIDPVPVVEQAASSPSNASSQPSLVGTVPAGNSKDTPETTSAAKSDVSKVQQSNDMPLPGQANDHSTMAPDSTLKTNPAKR